MKNTIKHKLFWLVLIVVVVVFVVVAVNKTGTQTQTIKIGLVGSFTGNAAFAGENAQRGLDIALSQMNKADLSRIEIIKEDDMCSGKNSISAVQKLISVDHVNYIIGPLCNEASLATEKLFEDNQVISMTIGLPSNNIANMGPYHFSFSPEIEYLMKTLAKAMIDRNLKRVAIIHIVSPFQEENYRHFVKYFTEYGGQIVADQGEISGTTDFKSSILKIKQAKPDSLMLAAYTGDLNNILKGLNVQGLLDLPKFTIHAAENSVLLEEKTLGEGLIYPYPADQTQNTSAKIYADLYLARYNATPDPYSANVYDSLNILVAAIKKCGYENKECVRSELAGLKNYPGANGNLSVDERGVGTYKEIMLKTLKNGQFQSLSHLP
ncbi:MAG: ABC transporter substrate-binding protein [Candidatus Taylorbacteria bacterium]|nr:ABC transporter substrate-binding protein [Candidatus Taylorbacteria bacterium]